MNEKHLGLDCRPRVHQTLLALTLPQDPVQENGRGTGHTLTPRTRQRPCATDTLTTSVVISIRLFYRTTGVVDTAVGVVV